MAERMINRYKWTDQAITEQVKHEASRSWWLDQATREDFEEARIRELPRMQRSKMSTVATAKDVEK